MYSSMALKVGVGGHLDPQLPESGGQNPHRIAATEHCLRHCRVVDLTVRDVTRRRTEMDMQKAISNLSHGESHTR